VAGLDVVDRHHHQLQVGYNQDRMEEELGWEWNREESSG